MTHGVIKIICNISGYRYTGYLHTYHTGMDARRVIENCFDTMLKQHYYIAQIFHEKRGDSGGDIESYIKRTLQSNGSLVDWLTHGPSVQALIIASEPMMYIVKTKSQLNKGPKWNGADTPTILRIQKDRWVVEYEREKDGKVVYDFVIELANRIDPKPVADTNPPLV